MARDGEKGRLGPDSDGLARVAALAVAFHNIGVQASVCVRVCVCVCVCARARVGMYARDHVQPFGRARARIIMDLQCVRACVQTDRQTGT